MASPAHESESAPVPESAPIPEVAQLTAPAADASPLYLVVLRDVAIVAAALSLFAAADAWNTLTGTTLSAALALVDGLLVGLAVSALAHEWGHFAGARLTGGSSPIRPLRKFLPLFDYDYAGNGSRPFMGMSVGGNAAHWLTCLVLALGLPLATLGQAAVVAASFGFGVFASSVEFPVIGRAYRGASPLEALRGIPRDFLRRNGLAGAVAALFALVALA